MNPCKYCGGGFEKHKVDYYCQECINRQVKDMYQDRYAYEEMKRAIKKYDRPEERDFVTQKEVDTAVEELQRIAADLA